LRERLGVMPIDFVNATHNTKCAFHFGLAHYT
jgi:hypothetical protein